ncbi:enhancer of polycomb homolog 1 [Nilaparvata lugens]|uniref:enhancer of polycomb homolog 1 n=1 Tax=Nilaparvata lugens TaxID=108931 RepID=UPI00193D38CC|nr:enhancer of polycomb homolog 1 [Nilaparvata lugens]
MVCKIQFINASLILSLTVDDYIAVNRSVPELPSGVLKEEEKEHHLQRAIDTGLLIPTPETEVIGSEIYDRLYPTNYKATRQLIRVQPFDIEEDIPDYDMDSEDEAWLNTHANKIDITPLKFEEMMDRLENNGHIITQYEAKSLLNEDDDIIIGVLYDYWLEKRLKNQQPLIPKVKTEAHLVGNAYNHPYLAFRRHDKTLHTRKKQKNRESSYQKMIKLRRDLMRAVKLLDLVKRRETSKKNLLQLTIDIFEKRYQASDFSGQLLNDVTPVKVSRSVFAPIFTNQLVNQSSKDFASKKEKYQCRKKKLDSVDECVDSPEYNGDINAGVEDVQMKDVPSISASPVLEDTPFVFHRSKSAMYRRPIENFIQRDYELCKPKFRPIRIRSDSKHNISGVGRIGRGGRLILDRSLPVKSIDNFWESCDFTILGNSQPRLSPVIENEETEFEVIETQSTNYKEMDPLPQIDLNSDLQVTLEIEDLSDPTSEKMELNLSDFASSRDSIDGRSVDPDMNMLLDLIIKNSMTEMNLNRESTLSASDNCSVDKSFNSDKFFLTEQCKSSNENLNSVQNVGSHVSDKKVSVNNDFCGENSFGHSKFNCK